MSRSLRVIGLLLLGLTLAGCAARRPEDRAATRRSASGPITRDELESARYATLYDAVLALRGQWLQRRGPTTLVSRPVEIQVIAGDIRMGGVQSLRTMNSDNVVSIAFVDPVTAAQRWGGSHAQGAIVVSMQADGAPSAEPKPR
jgi:hypothetical protein